MDEEKLPRTAYDLIDLLDEITEAPRLPADAHGWAVLDAERLRRLAFLAGARALVDELVRTKREEVEKAEADESLTDGPAQRFARVLGPGRDVHTIQLDADGLDPDTFE
jgi:hypothetical protein